MLTNKSNSNSNIKFKNPIIRFFIIFAIAIFTFLLILAITIGCIWHKEIKNIFNIKELIPATDNNLKPVYYMEYEGDFWFDDFLEQGGTSSTDTLINFIINKISRGFYNPNLQKGDMKLGCTTFTATTQDNSKIFARNYDFDKAPICILKTNPGNGKHQTYSIFDMSKAGIKVDNSAGLSLENKLTLLASPYMTMDGINDAGVAVSILISNQGRDFSLENSYSIGTDINTDKLDLPATAFLRLILEQASSVNEAVEIAKNCDIHEFANSSFHYHVADANGNSAIIEWVGQTNETDKDGSARTLNVSYANPGENFQIASNYIVKEGYYPNGIPYGHDRYLYVHNKLSPNNGIVKDVDEAMDILSGVAREKHADKFEGAFGERSLWSVVYDLSNKTVTFIDNEKYDEDNHKLEFQFN